MGSAAETFEESVFKHEVDAVFVEPDFAQIGIVGSAVHFAWCTEGKAAFQIGRASCRERV